MKWRDIRFEKPTEDKAILVMMKEGLIGLRTSYSLPDDCIAWMPLSELPEFKRIPDPPEGWRFVQKEDTFNKQSKFWEKHTNFWATAFQTCSYDPRQVYIVPIEPQYRDFDTIQEWWPHRNKFVKRLFDGYIGRVSWNPLVTEGMGYKDYIFLNEDGSEGEPFGVKIE